MGWQEKQQRGFLPVALRFWAALLVVLRTLSNTSPPLSCQCCQIRCSLLTKQKHVAFFRICFVLCAVASLCFSSCFSCELFLFFLGGGGLFKRRIFNDLVGCRCLLCLSRFLFDVRLRERFLFLFCCLFCFSFLFFLFLLAWLMKRLMH